MRLSTFAPLLLCTILFCHLAIPTLSARQSYIVYLGPHLQSIGTASATSFNIEQIANSHYDLLSSFLESKEKAVEAIFYTYAQIINGFAAVLDEEQAAQIANHPDVISVFLNRPRKLHTTHSWNFLGLENHGSEHWKEAKYGEDVIIGNLDTGVWPESKSFNDEGMGPIPSRWKGICQPDTQGVKCNKKLIGSRYFNKGYAAAAGNLNSSFDSARDTEGHGSHTLSTAGGSFVPRASVFGNGNGTAEGGSPKARVAAYKVCWPAVDGEGGCYDADILAGYDAAISDGVDVISVSLGGSPTEFFQDGTSIGAFHAVKRGIVVVASAGNDGPTPMTVSNLAPWILTVGASSMDREFTSYVTLGNKEKLKGTSMADKSLPSRKLYLLTNSADAKSILASASDASLCKPNTLDPIKVKGKIIVCTRGITGRVDKGLQAALAGAVGMILVNDAQSGNELLADPHVLPASHLSYTDGVTVLNYINSTKIPTASIGPVITQLNTKLAPVMAAFSSRGPNQIEPTILKPDVTAPGVNVIAAFSEAISPSEEAFDKRRVPYITMSGTSMSCPHVSGIVGLLKNLHPTWSPAAIKSAIMTTATTIANNKKPILDSTHLPATPFAYGAGHVTLTKAMNPGLVYDMTDKDYLNFLCARGYNDSMVRIFSDSYYTCPELFTLADFNYPSITVPNLKGTMTATRRVKNVGSGGSAKYKVHVSAPSGVSIVVKPKKLVFKEVGEEKRYRVVLKPGNKGSSSDYAYGELVWSNGKHSVRSPIVVKQG